MLEWLRSGYAGWLSARPELVTALVSQDSGGRWSVDWQVEGGSLPPVRELTLTDATTRAAASAAALYGQPWDGTGAQVRLLISLGPRDGGPVFDVQGVAGSYVARDTQGSGVVVRGSTLEALVDQVRGTPGVEVEASKLRWVRPVGAIGGDGQTTVVQPPLAPKWAPGRMVDDVRFWLLSRLGHPHGSDDSAVRLLL